MRRCCRGVKDCRRMVARNVARSPWMYRKSRVDSLFPSFIQRKHVIAGTDNLYTTSQNHSPKLYDSFPAVVQCISLYHALHSFSRISVMKDRLTDENYNNRI